jgi:hypothetical protein
MSLWGQAFSRMRLPSGGVTDNREEYRGAWDGMISFLEAVFPGYRVFAYDPGFMLSHPEVRNGPLSITGHAVAALMEGMKARKAAEKGPRKRGKRS